MFTGIIEELGVIRRQFRRGAVKQLEIKSSKVVLSVAEGQSVCVNGVCLTVAGKGKDYFSAQVMEETLKKTSLGKLRAGEKVNLERALRASSSLDGHLVQGHVDGQAVIAGVRKKNDTRIFYLKTRQDIYRQLIPRGSIALDGISLTIAGMRGNIFQVGVIPYTLNHTNLLWKKAGDVFNVELDYLGKIAGRQTKKMGYPT